MGRGLPSAGPGLRLFASLLLVLCLVHAAIDFRAGSAIIPGQDSIAPAKPAEHTAILPADAAADLLAETRFFEARANNATGGRDSKIWSIASDLFLQIAPASVTPTPPQHQTQRHLPPIHFLGARGPPLLTA